MGTLHRQVACCIVAAAVVFSAGQAAADARADVAAARSRGLQAQQNAKEKQRKAQDASRRASRDRAVGAGYGGITYKDGAYYWGEKTANGERDGFGILVYQGGRCECQYSHDRPVGAGVVISSGGDRYEGEFHGASSGFAAGYGVYTWADGRRYEGEFANDHPSGLGVLTEADGVRHGGVWKDGKLDQVPVIVHRRRHLLGY